MSGVGKRERGFRGFFFGFAGGLLGFVAGGRVACSPFLRQSNFCGKHLRLSSPLWVLCKVFGERAMNQARGCGVDAIDSVACMMHVYVCTCCDERRARGRKVTRVLVGG
jgi:hypothetical protein